MFDLSHERFGDYFANIFALKWTADPLHAQEIFVNRHLTVQRYHLKLIFFKNTIKFMGDLKPVRILVVRIMNLFLGHSPLFAIFHFQTFFWKISQKLLVFWKKTINTCFVAKLSSFQENFKLLKSNVYYQSYDTKNTQVSFHSISLFVASLLGVKNVWNFKCRIMLAMAKQGVGFEGF